jgi:hypothetical protein
MKTRNLNMFALLLCLFLWVRGAPAETVVWSENFDDKNGDSRWYAEDGVWQIGTPTFGPAAAHSLSNCAATGLSGNYPGYANSRLIRVSSFTVPGADQNPRLRFWHWYSMGFGAYGVVAGQGRNQRLAGSLAPLHWQWWGLDLSMG